MQYAAVRGGRARRASAALVSATARRVVRSERRNPCQLPLMRDVGADPPGRALHPLVDLLRERIHRGRGRTETGSPPPAASRSRTLCATVL
jgi:hypothetical protein